MKISIHHLQQLKKHWFRVTTQPPAMETNHFSSPNAHTYNLESLLRCRLCPISPGWGLRVCISNKAQDDAEADGPATTLWGIVMDDLNPLTIWQVSTTECYIYEPVSKAAV